jgi:steroid delta-isomerase-like uncharacterized protein
VRRFYEEALNGRDLALLDQLVSPDLVDHYAAPGQSGGLEGLKQFLSMILGAFPDLGITVEDLVAEGDRVVARLTLRGTHDGPFFGVPATSKVVTWPAIHVLRLEAERIVERWALADVLGIMGQIGAL